MKEALLSLQYKGIRTPWEIFSDPTTFGWQCRKYLRWTAVQTHADDRAALKSMADSLIDDASLDTKLLPTINRIFERVQRWRKDKENFSIEPDERENYIDLKRNIALAIENPALITELLSLRLNIASSGPENDDDLVTLFYAAVIAEFLKDFKGGPFCDRKIHSIDVKTIPAVVAKGLLDVYRDFGLGLGRREKEQPLDILRTFLGDIGIAATIKSVRARESSVKLSIPAAIVETVEALDSVFVRTSYRQGKLYIAYNTRHPWVIAAGSKPADLPALFKAIGESTLSMLGDKDTLDLFFDHLGTSLARTTRKHEK